VSPFQSPLFYFHITRHIYLLQVQPMDKITFVGQPMDKITFVKHCVLIVARIFLSLL